MSVHAVVRPEEDRLSPGMRISLPLAAEAAVVVLVVGLAAVVRLIGLADHTNVSDEGIRGVQLRLLAAGYLPVSEIYAAQGPLSLWLFYPSVALFGPDILVGRLTVVVASLVVLVASAWIARRLGGPIAGLATGLILGFSPVAIASSRLAFVELPSIAPTILGLILLVVYRQDRRRRWLIGSAALFAVGALAKPMAAVAGLAALVVLLAPAAEPCSPASHGRRAWRARLTDLALFSATGLLVCALVVLAIGPAALYEQVVAYRLGALAVSDWTLAGNRDVIAEKLQANGWGVLLAGALGGIVALRRGPLGIGLLAWLGGGVAALLFYWPLWGKHVTYVLPPLAILAGLGFASVAPLIVRRWDCARLALGVPAVIAICLVVAALPDLLARTRATAYNPDTSELARHADDLLIVSAATAPTDFVVVDDAYLAMLTGRLVPPFLADLSTARLRAGGLTADQAIDATQRFGARVLVVQSNHLGRLRRYWTWADREYVLVKSYAQDQPPRFRGVYVHPDADLGAVRAALRSSLATPADVLIGPARLLAYELDRREVALDSRLDLTLMFETIQQRPAEHLLLTRLRDGAGQVRWEREWAVGGGSQVLHTWRSGRWQVQTLNLPIANVPAGPYSLTIVLQPRGGIAAPVTAFAGARPWPTGDEIDLGEVRVTR